MKTNHTDITIVLDRSGSMQSVADDTIGGFNKFLADQQAAPGTADLSLNQFDDVFERVIRHRPVADAKPLDRTTFVPRGSTALLDAIGRSITETGKRLDALPEGERPAKVVCVIITDGFENASREFTSDKIAEMIAHQRDVYKWEFVFLGANQDAIASASRLNIPVANAMTYSATADGVDAAYHSASSNLRAFRGGQCSTMAFSAEDREEQKKAGV